MADNNPPAHSSAALKPSPGAVSSSSVSAPSTDASPPPGDLFPRAQVESTGVSQRFDSAALSEQLNPEQLTAVLHEGGPLLVFAGAGSGKTRVLTYRLAHLIHERGCDPLRIMAVTFTNKAAREMKERVSRLIGGRARGIWNGTFHAICARMLRSEISRLGYNSNFVVFDDGDQMTTMREVIKGLNLDTDTYQPRQMLNVVSRAKEKLIDAEEFARQAITQADKTDAKVYRAYQARLRENNALDFDDLIFLAVQVLEDFPEVRERYQARFQQILVDEFQDVNYGQYRFIKLLSEKWRSVVCVGDDDQSIYGWRGADVSLILRFEQEFPDSRVVKLEQNYRCTASILACANAVVQHNRTRKPKQLWTQNAEGDIISAFRAQDERHEALFVVDRIGREKRPWSDFAVLYRTNAQSRALEEAFRSHQTPYRMVGGQRFYERKEIKDVISYLRLIYNPEDRLSALRAIAAPSRGIGPASLERLVAFAEAEHISLYAAMIRADEVVGLTPRVKSAAGQFGMLIQEMRRQAEVISVGDMIERLLERSGLMTDLRASKDAESADRIQNIHELLNTARQFERDSDDPSLRAFLETLALASDLDTYQEGEDAVTLMTLHSAKGLEFPIVFMVGMEDGLFPSQRSMDRSDSLEEERRLCYVGITRAKERLFVTHAMSRMMMGVQNRTRPSRFLKEMGESLESAAPPSRPAQLQPGLFPSGTEHIRRRQLERSMGIDRPAGQSPVASGVPLSPTASDRDDRTSPVETPVFAIGDRVKHRIFGVGLVVGMEAASGILRVAFEGQGIKKLQIGVAPLEKVERKRRETEQ